MHALLDEAIYEIELMNLKNYNPTNPLENRKYIDDICTLRFKMYAESGHSEAILTLINEERIKDVIVFVPDDHSKGEYYSMRKGNSVCSNVNVDIIKRYEFIVIDKFSQFSGTSIQNIDKYIYSLASTYQFYPIVIKIG